MATYGGGTNINSTIVTTNPTVNNSGGNGTLVAYTVPAARYAEIRLLSFSLPSGTSVSGGAASVSFQADNGIGGWTEYANHVVPDGFGVGGSADITISGIAGQLPSGSFTMPYGTRIVVNGGTGGGGTARFQISVTEYFSST
jgi:hypothetical protein